MMQLLFSHLITQRNLRTRQQCHHHWQVSQRRTAVSQQLQLQQQQELDFDRQGLQAELQVLSQYRGAMEAKWNELRGELSRLYRTNRQLVSRLTTAG